MPDDFSFKKIFSPLTTTKAIHIIIIVGIIVYFNALFNGFVADDITLIITDPTTHSISNFPTLLFQVYTNASGEGLFTGSYYAPLKLISYSFLYTLFGDTAFVFHFFQISLHIINTVLIFSLFSVFFLKRISLFLSLIFLVHPINQETVAYIASLQDVLFLFFGLLALFFYQRFVKEQISWKKTFLVSLFIFLSLLSKFTGVLFIPLIFLGLLLFNKKQFGHYFIAFGITLGVYFLFKFFAHNVLFAIEPSSIARTDLFTRLMNIPKVILYYLGTFLFPKTLITHQDWLITSRSFINFHIPLLLDVVIFASIGLLGFVSHRLSKKLFYKFLFFSFWFLIGFSLHIQIIPLDFTVADRWFYFPIIGLLGLIAVFVEIIKIKPKVFIALMLIIVLIFSIRTIIRNENWRSGYSLYTHDIAVAKDNIYLNGLLGNELMNAGKYDEALKYFNKASIIGPSQWRNWINMGAAYYSKGNLESAEKYFKKAIEVGKPRMGYERLGQLYIEEDKLEEAKTIYQEGVKQHPQYQVLQLYLAYTEYNLNNKKRAFEIAAKAYQTFSTPEAFYVLTQIKNDQEIKLK